MIKDTHVSYRLYRLYRRLVGRALEHIPAAIGNRDLRAKMTARLELVTAIHGANLTQTEITDIRVCAFDPIRSDDADSQGGRERRRRERQPPQSLSTKPLHEENAALLQIHVDVGERLGRLVEFGCGDLVHSFASLQHLGRLGSLLLVGCIKSH